MLDKSSVAAVTPACGFTGAALSYLYCVTHRKSVSNCNEWQAKVRFDISAAIKVVDVKRLKKKDDFFMVRHKK